MPHIDGLPGAAQAAISGQRRRISGALLTLGMAFAVSAAELPFPHTTTPLIPYKLRAWGAKATGEAINDKGEVAGVYTPQRKPAQIFIYSAGKLTLHDYPCEGYLHISSITNTGLVAGYCQTNIRKFTLRSFLFTRTEYGALREITPPWPQDDYIVNQVNDKGDAIGLFWKSTVGGDAQGHIAFIYTDGQLTMVDAGMMSSATPLLNESGQVLWQGSDKAIPPALPLFLFKNKAFVPLTKTSTGKLSAMNGKRHWVTTGPPGTIDLHTPERRRIDCEKESCYVSALNDKGWIAGHRGSSLPLSPMGGVSLGHAYVWIDPLFYPLGSRLADMDTNGRVNNPVQLSQRGHILYHDLNWPYLITPVDSSH